MPSGKTTFEETQVSLPIKLFSDAATALDSMGLPLVNLNPDKLKAKAEQSTGLHDWGSDPAFFDDLKRLIGFVQTNPNSNILLKITFREDVLRRMSNYLMLQDAKKRHPEMTAQPVSKPIFILGLPRTGTTLLQRLMAQDPQSHGPALWELHHPVQSDTPDSAAEQKKTEAYVNNVRTMSLRLWSIHPTFANQADECYFMLPQSIGENMIYVGMDYFDWFMKRSAVPDYQLHKQYLQAMHYNKPQRKWILKSPVHTPKLNDLLTVYPDAQVIFCHRSLGHVIASWASFVAISRKYVNKRVNPKQIARDWMNIWAISIKDAEMARAKYPASQFYDVDYDELVLDPIAMVRKIYDYNGMEFTVAAEARMRQWMETDRHQERLGHRYTLDQFDISDSEVEQAFKDYMVKHDLSIE